MMHRYALPATATATVLALSGCALMTGGGHGTHSGTPAASAKPGDMTGGHHYRAGYFYSGANHAALDIHRVERYPTYSVLYLDLYALGKKADGLNRGFTGGLDSSGFSAVGLLDSVNGKYYQPLSDPDRMAFGTQFSTPDQPADDPVPGYRYAVQVYFPPLPPSVQRISVITPDTTGPMPGIPVMNGGRSQALVPAPTRGKPQPGRPFFWEVTPPRGKIVSSVQDLHGHTEGDVKTETRGGGQEKIALRTDVLFAFDKATLSAKATSVLDDAIDQTRAQADPAKPPITITGYTDAKGSDSYNQKLSVRRANTVRKYIAGKLGATYRYQATGKGEADPVAPNTKDGSDNPAGRAKNRRVEIGYKIKQQQPDVTTTQTATPGPGAVTAPAAWRASDGPIVGSVNVPDGGERLDVHPFYRDGAYLVGILNIHDLTGDGNNTPPELDGNNSGDFTKDHATVADVIGSRLGAVVAYDPAGKTGYWVVRRGPAVGESSKPPEYVESIGAGSETVDSFDGLSDRRVYIYYPAPPADVTELDMRVGEFGTVKNVPIQ